MTQHNNKRRSLAKKGTRLPSRSNTKKIGVNDLSPSRLFPSVMPHEVESTIRLMKRVQINVPLNEASGSHPLVVSALMAGVPGGVTYWSAFRIESVEVWASDSSGTAETNAITVTVAASNDWNQPNFQVTDSGTVGNQRPRIGFKLGLLDRARWFGTASTELLCLIAGVPSTSVVVQATVELISPSLSAV